MTHPIESSISLKGLEISVHLGWPQAERLQAQTVFLDIRLQFPKPPAACASDQLNDTYCYDQLVQAIKAHFATLPIRLLEHLGYEIYSVIKKILANDVLVSVRVKKKTTITNLTEGAAFYYGDMKEV